MPRVDIPVTKITRAGVAPPSATAGDATNDHEVQSNDGTVFIEANNTGAGAQTVTIVTQATVDGNAVNDWSVSVGAAATKLIGPFPPEIVNTSDGKIQVDVTVATWTFRAYRL